MRVISIFFLFVFINIFLNVQISSSDLIQEESPYYFDMNYDEYGDGEFFEEMKRGNQAGFWSPHPSDFNPLRRPGGQKPKNKRNVYHPFPKLVTVKQRSSFFPEEYFDDEDDGLSRDKKHVKGGMIRTLRGTRRRSVPTKGKNRLPNRILATLG